MAPDYRSERMESPEGRGNARRAWEAYEAAANKIMGPLVRPAATRIAAHVGAELWGFWLVWQLEGGFEGLRKVGFSRSAIYRRIKRFRQMTGQHPDEFQLPGVSFDLATYHSAAKIAIPDLETTDE